MEPEITYWPNGKKRYEQYWVNGEFHNPDGPACIVWHNNGKKRYEEYLVNGVYHNPNGPAYLSWHKNGQKYYEEYWVNGIRIQPVWFEELGFNIEHDFIDEDIRNMVILHNGVF